MDIQYNSDAEYFILNKCNKYNIIWPTNNKTRSMIKFEHNRGIEKKLKHSSGCSFVESLINFLHKQGGLGKILTY